MSQIHYLPLTPGFFAILVGIFVIVLILRSVRYAYESIGVSSGAAMFLLFATWPAAFSTFRSPNCRRSVSYPTR